MAQIERDPITGQYTTGHQWDGIKELRTPIPQWWLMVFLASIAFAFVSVQFLPSFPTTEGAFQGSLGYTARLALEEQMEQARQAQAAMRAKIAETPLEEIVADEELATFAYRGGQSAYAVNCIACHGVNAGGQLGQFPSLIDDAWLWGGDLQNVYTTINHGIRNGMPNARVSAMPAYATILSEQEIEDVADYVLALNPRSPDHGALAELPGAAPYEAQCVACHGADGAGNQLLGAPRLNDAIWLYGGSRDEVIAQIANPKLGVMPAFGPRLNDDAVIKMLAVYVHSLGGGEDREGS